MEGVWSMIQKRIPALMVLMIVVCCAVQAFGAKGDRKQDVLAILYFNADSAEIKPEFENDLKKIQAALDADPTMGLRIEGYGAIQDGSSKQHMLPQKRIQAVMQWFAKQGVAGSRLAAKHIQGSAPVVTKGEAEDPVHSERVEILRVSSKLPLAFLPAARYQFNNVVEGQVVSHEFVVQNKGSAPLEIQRVKTD
jgi:hypothetical protein